MRQYKFDKPIVETKLPVRNTGVYWADVDEKSGCLANIMEFTKGDWYVKFLVDDIAIWKNSQSRLDIPDGVKLNPDGIVAAWLAGDKYSEDVKEAADEAGFSYVIGELSALITAVNAAIPVINSATAIVSAAGEDETAEALEEATGALNEAVDRFNDDEDIIDKLEALDAAIYETGSEEE